MYGKYVCCPCSYNMVTMHLTVLWQGMLLFHVIGVLLMHVMITPEKGNYLCLYLLNLYPALPASGLTVGHNVEVEHLIRTTNI